MWIIPQVENMRNIILGFNLRMWRGRLSKAKERGCRPQAWERTMVQEAKGVGQAQPVPKDKMMKRTYHLLHTYIPHKEFIQVEIVDSE